MRFHFPTIDRPKKAAKRMSRLLGGDLPLSKVQNGLAVVLGYRDWHELNLAHANEPPQPLDQDLPVEEFRRRNANLALKLAKILNIPEGKAQHALRESHLTGDQSIFNGGDVVLNARDRQVRMGSYITQEEVERFYPLGETVDWSEIAFGSSSFEGAGRLWPVGSSPHWLRGDAHDRIDSRISWAARRDVQPVEATLNQFAALLPKKMTFRPSWLREPFKGWFELEGFDVAYHTMTKPSYLAGPHLKTVSGPGIIVNSQIAGGIGEGWWLLSSPEDASHWEYNLVFYFNGTSPKSYFGIPAFRLPD